MAQRSENPVDMLARRRPGLIALVVLALIAYGFIFLSQPSLLFQTQDGTEVTRWVDISQVLLLESLVGAWFGSGRLEVGWMERLPVVLAGAAWLALAWCAGRPWVQWALRNTEAGHLEAHCLSVLSGLSLFSTATLLIGLAGGLGSRWPLLGVSVGLAAIAWRPFVQSRRSVASDQPPRRSGKVNASPNYDEVNPEGLPAMWLMRLIPVATGGLIFLYFLGSLMPPLEFDVVEYHLQAPKEFHQAGQIGFVDHNIYANMPLAAEMHSLAWMSLVGGSDGWWWGGLIGKAICGWHSLLAAALLGGFMARRAGRFAGWCAAGLLLASPGNAHVATTGLIDMVLATYLLASLVALTYTWQKRSGKHGGGDGTLVANVFLVSQLAGTAAACKYTGLPLVVLPILAGLVWALFRRPSSAFTAAELPQTPSCEPSSPARSQHLRSPAMRPLTLSAASLLGLAVSCLPWYAKNWFLTGNPFYPLAYAWFGGLGISDAQALQWSVAHRVPTVGASPYGLAALAKAVNRLSWQSDFVQPSIVFLIAVGAAVFLGTRRQFPERGWAVGWGVLACWVLAVWWLATHRIDRFWLPVVPVLAALAGWVASRLVARLSVALASAIVLGGLIYGGFIIASGGLVDNRFFVSLSALRVDAGDEEFAGRLSPATHWANEVLGGDAGHKLLLIGEAKAFDFALPIVYATCFDTNPGEIWLRGRPPAEQRAALQRAGVTHVLINWAEIERYRQPGNYGFSDWPRAEDFEQLVRDGVLQVVDTPLDQRRVEVFEVIW